MVVNIYKKKLGNHELIVLDNISIIVLREKYNGGFKMPAEFHDLKDGFHPIRWVVFIFLQFFIYQI